MQRWVEVGGGGAAGSAPPPARPHHRMSDEHVFCFGLFGFFFFFLHETKSFPVAHDSEGAVLVVHLFTLPIKFYLNFLLHSFS